MVRMVGFFPLHVWREEGELVVAVHFPAIIAWCFCAYMAGFAS